MNKLNTFEMLPKENANEIYSGLNVIVEELNGLGLNQMSPTDVARKILCVFPIEKYGHIVIVLHQGNLSTATPKSIFGKINAHEMYMHMNPQDSSSSTMKEKKDLALKASHKGKSKKIEVESSTSSDDDASIALLVRRTTKMLKKLNKNGVARGSPSPRWIATIVVNLIILLINVLNPRRTSTRRRTRSKMTQVMMRRATRRHSRREVARRSTTRSRMARLTLLVIGSPTLKAQVVTPPATKVMMRRLSPLPLMLHHHHPLHHLHPLHTYASWLRVTGRYKVRMRVVRVIVNMNHLLMMNLCTCLTNTLKS